MSTAQITNKYFGDITVEYSSDIDLTTKKPEINIEKITDSEGNEIHHDACPEAFNGIEKQIIAGV
jgi:hypothetical protein